MDVEIKKILKERLEEEANTEVMVDTENAKRLESVNENKVKENVFPNVEPETTASSGFGNKPDTEVAVWGFQNTKSDLKQETITSSGSEKIRDTEVETGPAQCSFNDLHTANKTSEEEESVSKKESPEAKPISDLVKKAQTVQRSGDSQEAKRLALLAIAWADLAKHSFLNDVRSTVTAQQLANWYGGCSYVMNQIEENLFAARCFYNAIVFDPQWTLHNHVEVSDKLGKALVYENDPNALKSNRTSILDFLEDLEMLADLSEKRQNWSVCVAIDGDINKILNFLRDVGVIQGNVVERPGRKRAMFRTARCYLQLHMHEDVRKLCSLILQNLSDYDDPEALEIWARSLYNTQEFDLAYEKSKLALKYCLDSGDRKRLEEFQAQILQSLNEAKQFQLQSYEDRLLETSAVSSTYPLLASSQTKRRNEQRRQKAKDPSGASSPSGQKKMFAKENSSPGETVSESLAAKIALNKAIPALDRSHKETSLLIERDLYYDLESENPHINPLPRNNKKQQEAIDKALMSRFSLIQGPPGTGKIYTGIKLIYLFSKVNNILHTEGKPKMQVLFCGPSNKSVDRVAEWMLKRMGKYCPDFVRVYSRSIETLDYPIPGRAVLSKQSMQSLKASPVLDPVALHKLIRNGENCFAEEICYFDRLFKHNGYQPMPDKVRRYVHLIREASIDELRKHDVILCTAEFEWNPKVLEATNVHQVIMYEAGMFTEPQCLVPIKATKTEQVVLIGDHKQLKPTIMCKEAGQHSLETSLFERYALTKASKNVQFTMLEEQYRMNPQICRFPSKQFYEERLKTTSGAWMHSPLAIWPQDDRGTYPHIFIHVEGQEKMLTVSSEDGIEQSKSNEQEIEQVIRVFRYLMNETLDDVQILAQYTAQVFEIKRRLREEGFFEENVTAVVSSQDEEWDYVVFSTVRSLPAYKIEKKPDLGWCRRNLGFITDQKQINVALTRARKGLIIIGNKNLLACDSVWKKLLKYYEERGCVKTPDEFPPKTNITRREKMRRNILASHQRYRESTPIKGNPTFYRGPFN